MIKEKLYYTIICDNCQTDCNADSEMASAWDDEKYAEEVAINSDWIKDNGNHYCSNCYYYDDKDKLKLHKYYH